MQNVNFDLQVQTYIDHIKQSYRDFWKNSPPEDETQAKIRAEMISRFDASIRLDQGKKYLKVVKDGAVHSFILLNDDGKFKCGDILKAASWAAPAKNFARGNILTGNFKYTSWTGA